MMRRRWFLFAGLAWFLLVTSVQAQQPFTPTQRGGINRNQTTSASNANAVVVIAALVNTNVRLYNVSARCEAGGTPAGTAGINIYDGSTLRWQSGPNAVASLTFVNFSPAPLMGSLGSSMTISLDACGVASAIGILNVQADQY